MLPAIRFPEWRRFAIECLVVSCMDLLSYVLSFFSFRSNEDARFYRSWRSPLELGERSPSSNPWLIAADAPGIGGNLCGWR